MNRQKLLFLRIGLMLVTLLTVGCGLLQPSPAPAPTSTPTPLVLPTVRRFLISTHSGVSSQPVVSDDHVAWEHKATPMQPLGTYRIDIYVYNLTTEQETVVTSVKGSGAYPLVAGNLLVWLDYPGFWGYRLAAGDAKEFRITNFQALPIRMTIGEQGRFLYERAFFALSDRVLVWSDAETKDTYDILVYDLEQEEQVRITDDNYDQVWPAAADSLIVWVDERNDEGDIYAYDLDTQEEFPIVTAALTQTMPSTDGRHVVWIDGRDGNDDVYAYDLETKTEVPVIKGPGNRLLPGVWGNFIIWMEQDSEGRYIYGYDMRLDEEFSIATEGGWPADARIWSDVVVWTEYREEDEHRVICGAALEY
jgi:beta propeller repeat protein